MGQRKRFGYRSAILTFGDGSKVAIGGALTIVPGRGSVGDMTDYSNLRLSGTFSYRLCAPWPWDDSDVGEG